MVPLLWPPAGPEPTGWCRERILGELIEAEATEVIGAAPREHHETRTT